MSVKVILDPEKWIDNHSDYLFNYAFYKVNNEGTAQDLVQDTFLAGLKGQKTFKGNSTERTWLVSILKRKIIDHYRKSSVRKTTIDTDFGSPFVASGANKYRWSKEGAPEKWNIDASNDFENEEFIKILEYCLSMLPDRWKEIFHLKIMEEFSGEEICKELDITSSNLWVVIHRAKLSMRACLEKNWIKA
jgi:RNA polymerase sigma-70 factor (TIGR02943 family)